MLIFMDKSGYVYRKSLRISSKKVLNFQKCNIWMRFKCLVKLKASLTQILWPHINRSCPIYSAQNHRLAWRCRKFRYNRAEEGNGAILRELQIVFRYGAKKKPIGWIWAASSCSQRVLLKKTCREIQVWEIQTWPSWFWRKSFEMRLEASNDSFLHSITKLKDLKISK